MTGLMELLGPDTALRFAALLLGHFLADFVFQTRSMAESKASASGLVKHGLLVFVVHTVAFLPFLGVRALVVLLGLGVLHIVIDRLKIAVERATAPSVIWFVIDQALHVAIAFMAAQMLAGEPGLFTLPHPGLAIAVAVVLAGAAFLGTGASAVTRLVLDRLAIGAGDGAPSAGHVIGILERLLIYVFALSGQWAAAVLVVAVKSLARFESLKDRAFAEYYLVGTLTSVLTAFLVGLAVRAFVIG